ncbi:MAG: hypothetical protein CSA55_03140 [Ilumatobacter coccineus]|uniref:PIN domain-containing protein n=1 Tax=Ilumatobacter coccineus TaxID=467094 RepID=A0A2G6KAC9_9ACTN|nr:MAG: hypothetical protein CSA55_03140 [Ilumatobacter coccineus]
MTLVLDTSALLALAVDRRERQIVADALTVDSTWCASALALAEALPAIDRLIDEPTLRADLEDSIRRVWDTIHVIPVDQACLDEAADLARRHPLHLANAIHLAAARRLPAPITFCTFDASQIPVALSLGYEVRSS